MPVGFVDEDLGISAWKRDLVSRCGISFKFENT